MTRLEELKERLQMYRELSEKFWAARNIKLATGGFGVPICRWCVRRYKIWKTKSQCLKIPTEELDALSLLIEVIDFERL